MAKRTAQEVKPPVENIAKIKVVGVGGSGGSALNRMMSSKVRGIEFIAINTDAQALNQSQAHRKVQIGVSTTKGLGAGMDPDVGQRSAEENESDIARAIEGADMVFLTCGLGGGTGTGSIPFIAQLAREAGALTVAVVTKPFSFEGAKRREIAESGYEQLLDRVDTIITIPNDRLLQIIDKRTPLLEAFSIVDEVLKQGVLGISEIITIPGLINVDFADVKAIMGNAGTALMGIGQASGENRAIEAARAAIDSPLLELSIEGAKGVLFTVAGGPDLSMHEVQEAAEVITASADPGAKIIFGTIIDDSLGDQIKITVIATGFKNLRDRRTNDDDEEGPSYRQAKTVFSPTMEEKKIFTKPKVEIEKEESVDEEYKELDIPRFIRNKMKK
ncbi:MAG: cell division protein FtsZ [Candidatus Komeilibacteria bacterium]